MSSQYTRFYTRHPFPTPTARHPRVRHLLQRYLTMKKPAKPTPDFPLFPHSNGQWGKKIKGRLRDFGTWSDPQAALAQFLGGAAEVSNGRRQAASKRKSVSDSPRPVKDGEEKPSRLRCRQVLRFTGVV